MNRKKSIALCGVLLISILLGTFFTPEANATPAFARQMQMECKSCHFQFFPKLNAFGRSFKLDGYTDVAVDTIDGDWGSSLPVNLNIAYVARIQYLKTTPSSSSAQSTGTDRGQLNIPTEGSFWIGGRVAENWGAKVEVVAGLWETGKIVYSREIGSVRAGFAVFSGESAGPGEGQELFNTGVSMMQRSWINMALTPLKGPLGTNRIYGAAQGITLFAGGDHFFTVLQGWTPMHDVSDFGKAMSLYYRAALTYDILGFDSMIGVFGTGGQSSGSAFNDGGALGDGSIQVAETKSVGMDLQVQGNITDGITIGLTSMLLFDTGDKNDTRNVFGRGDNESYMVNVDLGFLDDRAILKLNYLNQKYTGLDKDVNIFSVGAQWALAQNVQLRTSWSFYKGDIDGLGVIEAQRNGGMSMAKDTQFTTTLFYAF